MTINRYMVIRENGNIAFVKVTRENGEAEANVIREYERKTRTELDFAQEALARFENEYPDWAGVLTWEMIHEEDLQDEENVTI